MDELQAAERKYPEEFGNEVERIQNATELARSAQLTARESYDRYLAAQRTADVRTDELIELTRNGTAELRNARAVVEELKQGKESR